MDKKRFFVPVEVSVNHPEDDIEITQDVVELCVAIAVEALRGLRDKDGNALILHSLFVGSMGQTYDEKCAGFLHDVVEDTEWTFDDLAERGVPEKIISVLKLCTHEKDMDYFDYVQRIIDSGNKTAINVKLNDLHHNLARGKAYNYPQLVEKHSRALQMIESQLRIR